jgi:chemotaxis protein methyltransferase CheR
LVSALSGGRPEIKLNDSQFRMLCELVRDQSGLHFDEASRFLVEKRLLRCMAAAEVTSISTYLYQLRSSSSGQDEMGRLVDELTTNETYFFRELGQLRALIDEIIPELLRRVSRPVQIWSAGCSSGEEPYTIAMMALEAGLVPDRDLRIYASDIAPSMLAKARRGVYRTGSFRDTPTAMREKYFVDKDEHLRVRDDVRKHVDFVHLNLLDSERTRLLGTTDVVLCRNVIIYFDQETKKQVIDSFYDRLRPGGYLLLGHSESLITLSTAFELCHLRNDLVYRRPIPGEERDDPWHRLAREAAADVDGDERGR